MPIEQYTYWSMTLNNPTDVEMILIRNPNSKYIREFVWTPEEGEETGTPHIQAWVRMQRNQSRTFMKRLYPRASFRNCDKDEYNENVHDYAQKEDPTTRGAHHITLNDPIPSIERLILEVIGRAVESIANAPPYSGRMDYCLKAVTYRQVLGEAAVVERDLVREKGPVYAKVFVSPVYARLWKQYGQELFLFWKNNKLTEDAEGVCTSRDEEGHSEESGGPEVCEGDEASEGTSDEGRSEGTGSQSDEEDASSECGE